MSGYIGPIPVPQGIQDKESFTATASQTTFTTRGYTDGAFINVYLNGVRLINGTDYTATNGSDIVLTQAASVSDVLDFETFNSFSLVSQTFDNLTTKNPTHEDTDGGRESALSFQGEQSGGEISTLAAIQASHDGTADDQKGDLIFKTNDGSDGTSPTERLRLDSAGFVGINESAPSGILHVKGTSAAHGKVILEAGGSGGSANNNFVEFNKHDGTKLAEIEVGESVTNGGDIIFKTTPTGGSVTNRIRLRHDGGICFGTDNAEDNALDDYEEGTWTPVLGGSTSTSGQSYSVQAGTYTKIGNTVNAHAYISLSNVGTVAGTYAYIMGFPFTVTNSNGSYPAMSIGYFAGLGQNVGSLGGYLNKNTNISYVTFRNGDGTSVQYLSAGGIGAAALIFSITYNTEA